MDKISFVDMLEKAKDEFGKINAETYSKWTKGTPLEQ